MIREQGHNELEMVDWGFDWSKIEKNRKNRVLFIQIIANMTKCF